MKLKIAKISTDDSRSVCLHHPLQQADGSLYAWVHWSEEQQVVHTNIAFDCDAYFLVRETIQDYSKFLQDVDLVGRVMEHHKGQRPITWKEAIAQWCSG